MEEKLIRNIALICAIVGLVLLYYASLYIGNSLTKIGKITNDNIGMGVKICGIVESGKVSNNNTFLVVGDETGSIELVIFSKSALKLNESGIDVHVLCSGDEICSTGVVDEYPKGSGELEIIYQGGNISLYD